MKRLPWYLLVWKLITYGLGILVIYWLILKLTNHSPTLDQIIIAVAGFIVSFLTMVFVMLVKVVGDIRELKGAFVHHVKHTETEFARIAAELTRIHDRGRR